MVPSSREELIKLKIKDILGGSRKRRLARSGRIKRILQNDLEVSNTGSETPMKNTQVESQDNE